MDNYVLTVSNRNHVVVLVKVLSGTKTVHRDFNFSTALSYKSPARYKSILSGNCGDLGGEA